MSRSPNASPQAAKLLDMLDNDKLQQKERRRRPIVIGLGIATAIVVIAVIAIFILTAGHAPA